MENKLMFRKLADEFLDTYYNCKTPNTYGIYSTYPKIVNLAFSCELYLKYLYIDCSNSSIKGHNLYSLFDSLSTNLKNKILSFMDNENGYNESDFDSELKTNELVFEKVRYICEQKNQDILYSESFLLDLSQCLQRISYNI